MALGSISRNIPQQKVAAGENRTHVQPSLMLSPYFPFIDYLCSPVSALERGIETSNLLLHTIFLTGNICQTSVYLFMKISHCGHPSPTIGNLSWCLSSLKYSWIQVALDSKLCLLSYLFLFSLCHSLSSIYYSPFYSIL